MALMAMTLAFSAACRADDGTPGPAAPEAGPVADLPKATVHRPPTRRTAGQGIDESVRRMTRSLDLDPAQQAKLRQILLDQQRQALKVRTGDSEAGADRVGATLAIVDQTKARIRAMLNEEQSKKYSVDVPRDQTAPAQADLEHWMQLQESK